MAEWDLSACELNCATCSFFKAGQGDTEKQQEIIQWFKNDYGKEISPEQTMCKGCMGPIEVHWSPECAIRNCAMEKEVSSCYKCGYFVCDKLDKFANDGHESHRKAVMNLKEIKKIGYEAWLKNQPSA